MSIADELRPADSAFKPKFQDQDTKLYLSDDYGAFLCRAKDTPRKQIVVTFMAVIEKNAEFRAGQSQRVLRESGFDTVHIFPRQNRWYQSREIYKLLDIVSDICLPYAETVTYGLSMGGFAAIQASKALMASRTVAYAPQFSVDKRKINFERRWQHHINFISDFVWDDFSKNVRTDIDHHVVYDPRGPDQKHVREIAARAPVKKIIIPFGGHFVWHDLASAGIGAETLIMLIEGKVDLNRIRGAIRSSRASSIRYWLERSKHPRLREHALAKAVAISSDHPEVVAEIERHGSH